MNNQTNEIITRFFLALELLKDTRQIKSFKSFTDRYNINHGNFYQVRCRNRLNMFKSGWLAILVTDYKISPRWLLTGEGKMQKKPIFVTHDNSSATQHHTSN